MLGAEGAKRPGELRVLALVPYPLDTAPGQRYRIEQWAPYLGEEGVSVSLLPFAGEALSRTLYRRGVYPLKALLMARSLARRVRHAWDAGGYDVVFLYREASLVGPAWLERLARRRNRRLVYDFDDAIWVPYVSPRNRYFSFLKAPWKTASICRLAAAVTVGNEHLAEYARQFNSNVTIVPSTVSLRCYRPRPHGSGGGKPVIGWTGSHSSVGYLAPIANALRRLAQRRPFRFVVIGVDRLELSGVDVECRPWRSATEVEDLWDLDVGIMPLSDDRWSRGKCSMKAIQCMGVGMPVVLSPVGANRELVEDGVNGLHATTEDDWVEALDRLLADPELRVRLGDAGRRTVEERFSAETQAPRVARLLRSVYA
jgi:glycosyltransferase involved in cell wall biosynthesis